jgi:alanine racemase
MSKHRCWAEIDLGALRQNLAWIRYMIGAGVRIITVVKADAYGHGLKPIAATLMQGGTDVFGVANFTEAQAIRNVGKGWPILTLGPCLPHEIEPVIRQDVMATLSSLDEAERFSRAATKLGKDVGVHLKIDTGMGRLGIRPEATRKLMARVRSLPRLWLRGLYTHYSAVEHDPAFSCKQRERFGAVVDSLAKGFPPIDFIHVNNSGGILWEGRSTYTAVRPGLLVYGVVPPGTRPVASAWRKHLRPALTWKSRVGLIKEIRKGDRLSYGGTFTARRKMRVAVVTAGYGDGYMRSGSNRSQVLIAGELCPVVGRITMDQSLVDISKVRAVRAGDEVVLIGRQGKNQIDAAQLAEWCGTVPWEVLTNITYRVPRIYRGAEAA